MALKVTVIIPTLNEEESIGKVIDQIKEAFDGAGYTFNEDYEILLVDSSRDRTPDIGREKGCRIVTEKRKGYGRAYKTGFEEAKGEIICTLDGDLTYPAEEFPNLIDMLEKDGLDFITCDRLSRLKKGAMTASHRFGNWVLTTVGNILFHIKLRDNQSGMWVFRRSILGRMELTDDGMPLSEEIKIEAFINPDIKAREVPVDYRIRVGDVKLNTWGDGKKNLLFLFKKRKMVRKRIKEGKLKKR